MTPRNHAPSGAEPRPDARVALLDELVRQLEESAATHLVADDGAAIPVEELLHVCARRRARLLAGERPRE